MQYFTGSKDHNVAIRTRAVKMGLKLSEYGLFRVRGRYPGWRAKPKPASTRRWGCPGFRRSCAKTAARSKPPPKAACRSWWSCAHIRGDLHMHTTETDGRATLEEMADAARERGYEYIAITDHSKALAMANGLDEKRVVAFARAGARDQPRRQARASASSPAWSATSCKTAPWIWPTTRWPNSTW